MPTYRVINHKAIMRNFELYLNMGVVVWHINKCRQAFAEPHGDLSIHVYGERFKALLKATHSVVLKSTSVLSQVHAANLGKS